MKKFDYLFGWIANLGVVPLLRFAAFLLAPIFLALAFLRFSVTAVLDAMCFSSLKKIRLILLALSLLSVKAIMASESKDIIISRGEQRELSIPGLKRFSVGNREIIAYTAQSKDKLLIKGSKVGFTDLVVWSEAGKLTYKIYVLSKTKFLKTTQLAESLAGLNLSLNLNGPIMTVSGEIEKTQDYLYLHKLKKQYKNKMFIQVSLAKELKSFLAAEVYRQLFRHNFSGVSCEAMAIDLICYYEGDKKQYKDLLSQFEKKWHITFIRNESRYQHKNFKVSFKIIQVERVDGEEINFGFSKLSASPLDLFENGLQELIRNNQILLSESHLNLSTLAEPEAITSTNKDLKVEVGAQIPYQNIAQTNSAIVAPISWNFAGLKIKAKLRESFGKLFFDYESEFTRPSDNQTISGSKEKSSLLITPGKAYKIFHIGYQATSKVKEHLPGIHHIPLLRNLFGSSSTTDTFKRIEGYLQIEELP